MPPPSVNNRPLSTSTTPSSPKNPHPHPASRNDDHQQTLSSDACDESDKHQGLPAGSGRTRPRFAKVRRKLPGRSRAVSGELNPVGSVTENLDWCNNSSNGGGKHGVSNGNGLLNEGFVFRAREMNSSVDFVFGAGKERICIGNEGENLVLKAETGEFNNPGSACSSNGSDFEVKLGLGIRESNGCGVKGSSSDVGEINLPSGEECRKNGSSNGRALGLDLNLSFKEGEVTESAATLASDNVGFDDPIECVGVSGSIFSFGPAHNEPSMNLGSSGTGFVFGASWPNSAFGSKECDQSAGSIGNLVFNDVGKAEVENKTDSHKFRSAANGTSNLKDDNDKDIFVFGCGTKKGSSVNECISKNCPGGVKSSSGTFDNCNNIEKPGDGPFKSFADSSNVDGHSSTNPVFCLLNEMMKLKIDDCKSFEVDNRISSATDSSFVFRSREEASANGSSGVASHEHDVAKPCNGNEYECSDRETHYDMVGASSGVPSSSSFIFQAGLAKSSVAGQQFSGQLNDVLNRASPSSSPPSVGLDSQAYAGVSQTPTMAGVGKTDNISSSTSCQDRIGVPLTDFHTQWDPACLKTCLFPEFRSNHELRANSGFKKGKRSEKMRVKLKKNSVHKQRPLEGYVQSESNTPGNLNSPGGYSPMDFSPYEETTIGEQSSRGTSSMSNHSNHLDDCCVPPSVSHSVVDSGLKDSGRGELDNENKKKSKESNVGDFPLKDSVFGADTSFPDLKTGHSCNSSGSGISSAEDIPVNTEANDRIQISFASGLNVVDGRTFSFSASTSSQSNSPREKRLHRKKNRRKLPCEPFIIAPCPNVQVGDIFASRRTEGNTPEKNEQVKQGLFSSIIAVKEACEAWRLRGNQAHQNRDLTKAEDFYTHGINSVPSNWIPDCCCDPLVMCYSNRAATRMSLGKLREALGDCVMAASLDPNFFKVQMRAANCHLLLGEVKNACHYFSKCLESGVGVCLDRRITIDAADGLQKAQRVAECISSSAKHLEQWTSGEALVAINAIDEALSISPYSESLLEMKGKFLLVLGKYKDVIPLCEGTITAAEKYFASVGADSQLVDGGETLSPARVWRWYLMSKSNFYLGKLEVALDLLEKLEPMQSISNKHSSKIIESSIALAATMRNLLHHKNVGNEAFRSGRYTEAVEYYTAALSCNVESRPFASICYGNRAAAHQALGQITEAIADCSLAIALDGNYSKAVSRRALLHEMIRDYGQAASDLKKLTSILESQPDEKSRQSGSANRTSRTKELRQARRHLPLMEEEAKKGVPLDLYRILGVKESDTAADIKKAYRKAALRHHPDKAGQFLVRSDSGDEGRLWKEILQEVHVDADRLFKMIGEAYGVLSDTKKRSEYDLNEEIRKASKENKGYSPSKRTSDAYSYPYDRSNQRRYWQQDSWKTYGNSQSRW